MKKIEDLEFDEAGTYTITLRGKDVSSLRMDFLYEGNKLTPVGGAIGDEQIRKTYCLEQDGDYVISIQNFGENKAKIYSLTYETEFNERQQIYQEDYRYKVY